MPIRIRPELDLKPCKINNNGFNGIVERVHKDFPDATYCATDYVWEIYDETKDTFLAEVLQRENIDSFSIKAQSNNQLPQSDRKEIEIVFSETEASFICKAHPSQKDWVEHILIDINKHLLAPSLLQRMAHNYFGSRAVRIPFTLTTITGAAMDLFWGEFMSAPKQPYCRIILREKPSNSFIENIMGNLVSNIIWLVFGALALLIIQLISQYFGVDLNPFD